jgi:hypothetical protein
MFEGPKLMLRRAIWTTLLIALVIGSASFVVADQEEGSLPRVIVQETIKDFGVVNRGDRVTHEFRLDNAGSGILEITEVRPSCGCTVADYDKTIAPGTNGVVKATMDTSNLKGGIAKAVRVYTNDPVNPELNLVMKANVKSQIEIDPGYARFVAVYGEPQKTIVEKVWSSEYPDIEILKVQSPFDFVETSFREAPEEERDKGVKGRQWQIAVKLDQDAPVGLMAHLIVVTTNHPELKTVPIPLSGFVRPILSVTPRVADFGRRELTENQTASLEVRNLGASAVELGEVSTNVEGLDAEIEQIEDGRLFKILLTLKQGAPKGGFDGLVTITTTSNKQPTIEVSVKGVVL